MFGVLGLLATGLAIGPASAGDDRRAEERDQTEAAALRSTGVQATADSAAETADGDSDSDGSEAGQDPATPSAIAAAGAKEIEGERINQALQRLTASPASAGITVAGITDDIATDDMEIVDPSLDPPVFVDDLFTADEDSDPLFLDVYANDTGNFINLVSFRGINPVGGTVECDDVGCTFTLDPDFDGTASFDYDALEGANAFLVSATVTIEVNPINDGPRTTDRFLTTTYGAEPLVIDGLDGVTDPEGDPVVIDNAIIIEGVGQLEIDGTALIYTPPSEPVINPFASIDVFYQDANGAFGVGHIFIEILSRTEPTCETIELFTEQLLVNRADQRMAFTVPEGPLGCEYYELQLISSDPQHGPGYQSDQTDESWYVNGLSYVAELIEVVYTSPTTPDLPDGEREAVMVSGPISPAKLAIGAWEIRHAGEGGANSVYATLRLVPADPPPPPGCEPIALIEDIRLLNRDGDREVIVPFTPPGCPALATIALVSADLGHEPGFQPDQDEEFWSLEAYDGNGDLLFFLEGPDDLPDDVQADFVYVDDVDLSDVAEFRVVHDAAPDAGINSIEASVYIFFGPNGMP